MTTKLAPIADADTAKEGSFALKDGSARMMEDSSGKEEAAAETEATEKERLLEVNDVLILPMNKYRDDVTGMVAVKSSKKVTLPEEHETSPGAGAGAGFTIGPAQESNWEMVPPDGSWGWCILVGATLVNVLVPGSIKSFGVLFVEFMEVFDAGPTTASAIPALCYFLYSSLGPVSSILSVKWSYRTVTLMGGCFAALGMIISSWANSISYLYVSYGVLVGTGAGLSFPPTVYIVTSYFVRLRGVANGICMSGSAFGSIILPPLLRYLLELYGFRGAVLIMGGIMLNVLAAALLFQPVEENMVRRERAVDEDDLPQMEIAFMEEEMPINEATDDYTLQRNTTNLSMENGDSKLKFIVTSEDSTPTEKFANGSPPGGDHFIRSVSAAHVQNLPRDTDRKRKVSMPLTSKGLPQTSSKIMLSNSNSASRTHVKSSASLALESVPEGRYRMGSQETFGRKLGVPRTPKRSPSTSSFQYMSTPFHGSTLSAFEPNEFASQFSIKSVTESFAPITDCCGRKRAAADKEEQPKQPNKYFDITLLADPAYLVMLISNCSSAISYTNFIILLPSYAIDLKYDKTSAAYLLSIVSAFDLVGRIGGSALSDTNILPKTWYFVGGLLISGCSLVCMPLDNTYIYISVWCSIFGLASGVYVGVTALVMADMLGEDRLTSSYGISLFVNGILQLIGPPICGMWFEATKEYKSIYITLGVVSIVGSALWSFMPFINRRRRKKAEMAASAGAS